MIRNETLKKEQISNLKRINKNQKINNKKVDKVVKTKKTDKKVTRKKSKKKNNTIKGVIKKIVPGTLALYLGITLMSSSNATNIILNKTQKNIGIITSNIARADTMDEDVSLLDAIEQNENLTREDKALIDTLEQLIIEDEYLDINQAKRALRTIKINYNVEKPIGVTDSTKARYNEGTNIIDVYESSETINKDLLRHEIVHSIYVNIFTKFLPDYFSEGMTELLINEYVSELHYDEKTTYPFEVTMVKVLCEMVGSNNVRKTFAKGNMKTIERKVEDIAGTQRTKDFFKTVENIFKKYESGIKISDDEYNKMMNFLDSYFTYTYQEDKDEEKYERYLYYRGILSLLNKENSYNSYLDYLNETYTPRYPYFSSELGYNGQNSYTYQYTK